MEVVAMGRVWKLPDDVDTDMLAPTQYLTLTPEEYSKHCLESLREDIAHRARKGDVIVAGENFGKGSSREHAAMAVKMLGIRVVVAKSTLAKRTPGVCWTAASTREAQLAQSRLAR